MKKLITLCALAFLTTTVTNTVDYRDANSATKDLFTIVKNDPYNWQAIKKAIEDGADVHMLGEGGDTILHELLYSANRSRQTHSISWVNGMSMVNLDRFDHNALFPMQSLKILLNAGANPTKSYDYYKKHINSYEHKKSFIDSLKWYKNWPDANAFMDSWTNNSNKNGLGAMAAVAFATGSVVCAEVLLSR